MLEKYYVVGFKSGGGFYGWVIRLIDGPYNHVGLLDQDMIFITDTDINHPLGTRLFKPNGRKYDIGLIYLDPDKVNKFIKINKSSEYDILGVLRFIFPFIKQDSSKWYCSEFIKGINDYAGVKSVFNSNKKSFTPTDIMKSLDLL